MADRLSIVFDTLSVNRPNIACVQASAFTPFGAQPGYQQYSAEILFIFVHLLPGWTNTRTGN